MRSVPEWVAKHDDERVPDRVRLRIFDRCEGRCHISGRKIQTGEAWELDHIKALANGGEHRESNLAPALVKEHRKKTAIDRRLKAKTDRMRKKHLGMKSGWTIAGRRFDGTPIPSRKRG
jgi:5-methylcytosine-specific restriction protein A